MLFCLSLRKFVDSSVIYPHKGKLAKFYENFHVILRILASKDVYLAAANIPRNRQRKDIPRNRQRQDKTLLELDQESCFEVEFAI